MLSLSRMLLHSERSRQTIVEAVKREHASGFMKLRGKHVIDTAVSINNWSAYRNVLSWKMESMFEHPEEFIGALLEHVDTVPSVSANEIWMGALGSNTLTKSDQYPDLDWTDSDEQVFHQLGGPQANEQLGYEE